MELRLQEFSHRLHPEIKLSLHVVFGPAGDYRDDPRMVSEPFQTTRIILVSHVVYESMGMPLIAYNLKPCPRRRVSAGRIPTALSTRSEQLGPSLVLEFLRSLHDSSSLHYCFCFFARLVQLFLLLSSPVPVWQNRRLDRTQQQKQELQKSRRCKQA